MTCVGASGASKEGGAMAESAPIVARARVAPAPSSTRSRPVLHEGGPRTKGRLSMKRSVLVALVLVAFGIFGCASSTTSSVASLASSPLVSSVASGVGGLSSTQAVAGVGALLGSAQSNLSAADWKKVTDAVPQTDALVTEAKSLTGVTGNSGSGGSVGSWLSKLGLTSDQLTKLAPAVTGYVSKAAGPEVGNLLAGALR